MSEALEPQSSVIDRFGSMDKGATARKCVFALSPYPVAPYLALNQIESMERFVRPMGALKSACPSLNREIN